MRIFGSEKIKGIAASLGVPEDVPIENKIVSKALEAAQAKIEGFHFDARKHVLEYDDVLNKQREAIYRLRREILFSIGGRHSEARAEESQGASSTRSDNKNNYSSSVVEKAPLREKILEMIREEVERLVEFHTQSSAPADWNLEEIFETVKAIAGVSDATHAKLQEITKGEGDPYEKSTALRDYLLEEVKKKYEEREAELGSDTMRAIERMVLLRAIDMLWMEHLDQMEHLRDSVRLRAYGQRDPLVEYKREGSRLYKDLQAAIRAEVVNTIFKVGATMRQETRDMRHVEERRPDLIRHSERSEESRTGLTIDAPVGRPASTKALVGRNDPCPCGSGKKYKRCHGKQ